MAITTHNSIILNLAQGKGKFRPYIAGGAGSGTAATVNCGGITGGFNLNLLGTTYPSTLVGFLYGNTTSQQLMVQFFADPVSSRGVVFGRYYLLGTATLTTTGDKFTHSGTFTKLTRTQFGEATKEISMWPIIYLTAATATTAPVIILKTAAGGTGYVDQDGNNVVGTKSFTFPAAATAIQSTYFLRLEDTTCAVRDIVAIQVTTAGTAGTANIYGFEPYAESQGTVANLATQNDHVYGGIAMRDISPAIPDAGSVTSYLGLLGLHSQTAGIAGFYTTVTNV